MASPVLTHLTDVGKTKAMGLLSYREICALGSSPQSLRAQFHDAAEYIVKDFGPTAQMWGAPVSAGMESLAIASVPRLQALLDENKQLLERAGWPLEAADFFEKSFAHFVLRSDVPCGAEIQDLIKKAYNHKF